MKKKRVDPAAVDRVESRQMGGEREWREYLVAGAELNPGPSTVQVI